MNKIDEIKQALAAATPGPWMYEPGWYGRNHLVIDAENKNVVCMGKTFEKTESDFALIANAPEWLAYLVGEVLHARQCAESAWAKEDALEKENERLREALEESFKLLEDHQPEWYLMGHYKRFSKALKGTEQ